MSEPGEPDAGPGTREAVEAARQTADPGGLQVDLQDGAEAETLDDAGLEQGQPETAKND